MLSNVGSTAANTGLGLLLQGHNNRVQLRQQRKLGQQQLGLDFQKMNRQHELALDMWEKTNAPAQVEQLRKAGLNVGMMYGGSGPGGTTGPGATGVSQPGARDQSDILGLQMINAQRNLIQAQTEKTQAEAKKISGVDTSEAETRIASLTQGIQNQKAQERLTTIQGNIAEIEQDLDTETYEDVAATIRYTARRSLKELGILSNEKDISDATVKEKIGIVQGELLGLGLANELKREQIDLTAEQTKKVVADIAQGWKGLSIQQQNAITNMVNSETAKKNADTNVREYIEKVRKSDMDYEIRQGALDLERMVRNVDDATKLTVGSFTNIFGSVVRGAAKRK